MVTLTWEPSDFGPGVVQAPTKGATATLIQFWEAEDLPASISSSPPAFWREIKRARVCALSSLLKYAHPSFSKPRHGEMHVSPIRYEGHAH